MKKHQKESVEASATTSNIVSSTPRVVQRKKKAARRSEKEESQSTEVEAVAEDILAASLVEENGEDQWRKWWRPQVLVDEQMSWGSVWYSFWEVDDFQVFYGDVLEEDDIWDLRKPKQLPPT